MTTQTKRFIEPGNILALCLECADCKASISLSLSDRMNIKRLRVCPNCQRPWLQLPEGSTAELAVTDLMNQLNNVSELLKSGQFSGFRLLLEISKDLQQD